MFKAMMTGRLTANGELQTTTSGKPVCTFDLATTDYYNGQDNTEYCHMELWGERARKLEKSLSKGQLVSVTASVRTRRWTDKQGINRERTTFFIEDFHFEGKKVERVETDNNADASNDVDEWRKAYDNADEVTTPVQAANAYQAAKG